MLRDILDLQAIIDEFFEDRWWSIWLLDGL
jgi:hypothetical protein